MSDSDEEFNDESLWETELEIALLSNCDYGAIRNISKLRPMPDSLRSKVWKVCLNVQQDIENNQISKWKEIYDLPQQDKIREDCRHLSEKLHPDDPQQQLLATSQLESIITFYCISNDEFYEKDNGWIEILHPIMSLNLSKNETFNFFSAIIKRYIPKDCVQNGSPYHLFRLLMLYHDPELCAFLDTKKISPDSYAHLWFRSLFAANSNLKVILNLWDMYFQLGDQFLIFFMSLILLFNIREEIMAAVDMERAELTKMILASPLSLNLDDLMDFNTLCQHFAAKTPQSFRKIFQDVIVKEYKKPLFEGVSLEKKASKIYQALCLPVSVFELLHANQLGSGVRYFIIDCRPAEKYNSSHYATAFHLDANLMLENPTEFNQSVEGLLAAQKQAIDSGSVAGGQHLCFMGTGNDDEDKYVNMVVSNFLQRKINFVSLALGGYEELKQIIEDPEMIVGTDVYNSRYKFTEEWVKNINAARSSTSMLNKFSNVFKTKSFDIKDKLKDYINSSLTQSPNSNDTNSKKTSTDLNNKKQSNKHVSASDKIGKLYRNQGNLFAIDDSNAEDSPAENSVEFVDFKTFLDKPDVMNKFKCFYREKKGSKLEWTKAHLVLTKTHLYALTQQPNAKSGTVQVSVRHHLNSIIKIATKSHCPEIISFTYGEKISNSSSNKNARSQETASGDKSNEETNASASDTESKSREIPEYNIKGKEWFYVPDYAGEAASAVKLQILEIVDLISH